ncbi:MAG: hypothetical protein AB7T06_31350 [Kofleriaceae bacterium]
MIVTETSCPFCRESLADAFANRIPRVLPPVRLGRAATFAFGVLAISQGACTERGRSPADAPVVPPDAMVDQGIPVDADDGGVAIYSAAPTPDAGAPSGSSSTSQG